MNKAYLIVESLYDSGMLSGEKVIRAYSKRPLAKAYLEKRAEEWQGLPVEWSIDGDLLLCDTQDSKVLSIKTIKILNK